MMAADDLKKEGHERGICISSELRDIFQAHLTPTDDTPANTGIVGLHSLFAFIAKGLTDFQAAGVNIIKDDAARAVFLEDVIEEAVKSVFNPEALQALLQYLGVPDETAAAQVARLPNLPEEKDARRAAARAVDLEQLQDIARITASAIQINSDSAYQLVLSLTTWLEVNFAAHLSAIEKKVEKLPTAANVLKKVRDLKEYLSNAKQVLPSVIAALKKATEAYENTYLLKAEDFDRILREAIVDLNSAETDQKVAEIKSDLQLKLDCIQKTEHDKVTRTISTVATMANIELKPAEDDELPEEYIGRCFLMVDTTIDREKELLAAWMQALEDETQPDYHENSIPAMLVEDFDLLCHVCNLDQSDQDKWREIIYTQMADESLRQTGLATSGVMRLLDIMPATLNFLGKVWNKVPTVLGILPSAPSPYRTQLKAMIRERQEALQDASDKLTEAHDSYVAYSKVHDETQKTLSTCDNVQEIVRHLSTLREALADHHRKHNGFFHRLKRIFCGRAKKYAYREAQSTCKVLMDLTQHSDLRKLTAKEVKSILKTTLTGHHAHLSDVAKQEGCAEVQEVSSLASLLNKCMSHFGGSAPAQNGGQEQQASEETPRPPGSRMEK